MLNGYNNNKITCWCSALSFCHMRTGTPTLHTLTIQQYQRQKKNKPVRMLKTANLTFQRLYRYDLYFIPDKAATERE